MRQDIIQAKVADVPVVPISAMTGEGVQALLDQLDVMLTGGAQTVELLVPLTDGQRLAWLHAHGEVLEQTIENSEAVYEVRLAPADYDRFMQRQGQSAAT